MTSASPSKSSFDRLFAFAAPHRLPLAAGAALMALESATALGVPWFGGSLAEALLRAGAGNAAAAAAALAGLLVLFALQSLIKVGLTFLLGHTAEHIVAALQIRVYGHLQSLPVSYFDQRRQGDTLALLTRDVQAVSGYICGTALSVAPMLAMAAGAVFFMFRIEPALALVTMMLIPLFYLAVKIFGRNLRPLADQVQAEHARAISIAEENLALLPAIKTFTREAAESERHSRQIDRIKELSVRQLRISAALGPSIQFIAAAGIVLVLWMASVKVTSGELAASELVTFLLFAQLLSRPIAGLADVYGQTQAMRASLSRLLLALDESPESAEGAELPKVRGDIVFDDVSFAYPDRPPSLDGVRVTVAAGETVAIVGPNGAGKSTLAGLLMRLHAPTAGRILIDGIDIATASLVSLRRQIGVVPQRVLLFNASVHDNIAFGRIDSTPAEIEAAARIARAHEFVALLPHGYDTVIGDRGVRLSGGQQQRIALARALLKDPAILVLDEATAMLDPEGEHEFLEWSRDALANRTVLLITHRPASLAVADRILRMEAGRVCEP